MSDPVAGPEPAPVTPADPVTSATSTTSTASASPPRRSYRHLVSAKGVCVRDGRVLLLRNEREEWELPGGQLEQGEDVAACVAREIAEETGWQVEVGPILSAWQYHIFEGVDVLVLAHGCHVTSEHAPVISHEHKEIGLFAEAEVAALAMPDGYRQSIAAWYARLGSDPTSTSEPVPTKG